MVSVHWTCTPLNIARTCGSFDSEGGSCSGLNAYPDATISDYGSISGNSATQNEIYHCGPIACGIDAMPLLNWESGIISTAGSGTARVISIVGSWPTRPKRNPLVKGLVLCPQIMFHEPAWSYGGRGLPGRSSIHLPSGLWESCDIREMWWHGRELGDGKDDALPAGENSHCIDYWLKPFPRQGS